MARYYSLATLKKSIPIYGNSLCLQKFFENNRTIKTQFLTALLDKWNRGEIRKMKNIKFHVMISRHTENHEDVLSTPHSTKQKTANGNGESGPMLRVQGRVPMAQCLSTLPPTANPSSESGCPPRVAVHRSQGLPPANAFSLKRSQPC